MWQQRHTLVRKSRAALRAPAKHFPRIRRIRAVLRICKILNIPYILWAMRLAHARMVRYAQG